MQKLYFLALLLATAGASAADKVDLNRGHKLVESKCSSCHVSMFGGDGSEIYTRPDRKVKNLKQLAARVSGCNANTGAGFFPDEEADVTAYLNHQYYKFK